LLKTVRTIVTIHEAELLKQALPSNESDR